MISEAAPPESKRLRHPSKGTLRFGHASFQANDDPDLKLIIYSPA